MHSFLVWSEKADGDEEKQSMDMECMQNPHKKEFEPLLLLSQPCYQLLTTSLYCGKHKGISCLKKRKISLCSALIEVLQIIFFYSIYFFIFYFPKLLTVFLNSEFKTQWSKLILKLQL